jgi:hypothetical protein
LFSEYKPCSSISGLVDEIEKTTSKINCQKAAALETNDFLKSKLKNAERLSDDIKKLKEEPSFMTQEDIIEEEKKTFEKLIEPKKIIEEVEKLESHPGYLGPNDIITLEEEIEEKRSILKRKKNTLEVGASKGYEICA